MLEGWADQYNCPSVVLSEPRDPDEVIAFARDIGAECDWETDPGEPADLVIDFQYLNDGERASGPEVHAEEAVRSQLTRDLATASVNA